MHSRDRPGGGWSAIIDPEEEGFGGEEEAQTDPQMQRNEVIQFSTEEKTTIDKLDPVTRAMLESEPEPVRGKPSISKSAPRAPVITPAGQPRKLRLPVPGENAPKKSRNGGVVESYTPQSMPAIAPDPASQPQPAATSGPAFSSESLVEKLSEGTGRAPKAQGSFFTEYKEVIRAVGIGVVLLGGAIAYQLTRAPAEAPPVIIPEAAVPAVPAKLGEKKVAEKTIEPTEPAPAVPRETEQKTIAVLQNPNVTKVEETPPVMKAATPMITVISTPPGATVEINGDAHGKTPLTLRSPRNVSMLSISLQLQNHKKWAQDVPANEAGHFTVNAQLEKLK